MAVPSAIMMRGPYTSNTRPMKPPWSANVKRMSGSREQACEADRNEVLTEKKNTQSWTWYRLGQPFGGLTHPMSELILKPSKSFGNF